MKKKVNIIVLLTIIACIIFSVVFIYASDNIEANSVNYDLSEDITIEEGIYYTPILNEQSDKIIEYLKNEDPEYYGGSYIDGSKLYILVTCDPKNVEKKIWEISGNSKIVINKVNYSYSYLESVREAVKYSIMQNSVNRTKTKNMYSGIGIDVINNKVFLEVIRKEVAKVYSVTNDSLLNENKTIQHVKNMILVELSTEISGLINEYNVDVIIKENPYTTTGV